MLLLTLSDSYLVKDLCTRKRKRSQSSDDAPLITRTFIVNLVMVLHNTLTFYQWMKKEKFHRFGNSSGNDGSRIQRIKSCTVLSFVDAGMLDTKCK